MGKTKKANHETQNEEFTDEGFELYGDGQGEDRWEDDSMGRFAKEQWSEGPKRRRSEWLRRRLDEARAGLEDELGYLDLRA